MELKPSENPHRVSVIVENDTDRHNLRHINKKVFADFEAHVYPKTIEVNRRGLGLLAFDLMTRDGDFALVDQIVDYFRHEEELKDQAAASEAANPTPGA